MYDAFIRYIGWSDGFFVRMFAGQGGHVTLDPMYITIYVVKSVELRGGGVKKNTNHFGI